MNFTLYTKSLKHQKLSIRWPKQSGGKQLKILGMRLSKMLSAVVSDDVAVNCFWLGSCKSIAVWDHRLVKTTRGSVHFLPGNQLSTSTSTSENGSTTLVIAELVADIIDIVTTDKRIEGYTRMYFDGLLQSCTKYIFIERK